ncbi:MAG TPA: hypothetical protein VIW69_19820 [Candidatus Elarobacter sp.]
MSRETQPPAAHALEAGAFYRLPPIYFVGDSRVIPFRNAIYASEFTSRAYQLRSVHLRCLHAADFYSRERGINLALLGTLATDQAVMSNDEGRQWIATRAEQDAGTAPLVLFCGPYDAHRVLDELGPDADITAWDERSNRYDVSTQPVSRLVSAQDTLQRVLEIMEPFALGIEALRTMGFDRIFIHGSPRSQRGERFDRLYGTFKWLRQSHPNAMPKVHMLFDEAARSIARRTSARYISGPVDAGGELSRDVTWDDVHYNAEGARMVARSVVQVLEGVVE